MNLINELQVSAESDDVQLVLRKAVRLASKLNATELSEWLELEQKGYKTGSTIPEYRKVKATIVMNAPNPIPVGMNMVASGIREYQGGTLTRFEPVMESMPQIIAYIDMIKTGQIIVAPISDANIIRGLRNSLNEYIRNAVHFMLQYSSAQILAIPDSVKDVILKWACDLESKGIVGDGLTFTASEKQIATTVTYNIIHSQIGQLTDSGTNTKGIENG